MGILIYKVWGNYYKMDKRNVTGEFVISTHKEHKARHRKIKTFICLQH